MADVFEVVFDGGSKGNPGKGYGSFEINRNGELFDRQIEVPFGDGLTNNQSEYMSLIHGLKSIIQNPDVDPLRIEIVIRGDSQLVIKQLNGEWKVKNANMQPLWAEARGILAEVGKWQAVWHNRSNSVKILGH
jgi:ribonuclease HI